MKQERQKMYEGADPGECKRRGEPTRTQAFGGETSLASRRARDRAENGKNLRTREAGALRWRDRHALRRENSNQSFSTYIGTARCLALCGLRD